MRILFILLYIIVCVILSVMVLMQEGKQAGLGVISGQPTYWDKNKKHSREGKLLRGTCIFAVMFFVLSLMLSMHPFA